MIDAAEQAQQLAAGGRITVGPRFVVVLKNALGGAACLRMRGGRQGSAAGHTFTRAMSAGSGATTMTSRPKDRMRPAPR